MSNNPNNIRLSACRVRYGGRDLGYTKGGVNVSVKVDTKNVQADQTGTSVLNEYVTGRTVTVKVPFAETDLDTIYSILKAPPLSTQPISASMADAGTVATGTITFTALPVAGDTVTLNGHVFTFVAAAPVLLNQVLIGATVAATVASLVVTAQMSSDAFVQQGNYVAVAGVLTVSYFRSGLLGNVFSLATVAATAGNCVASGATLLGGIDGLRGITIYTGVGQSLLVNARPLVLHPADRADNDLSEDFTVFSAGQSGAFAFDYKIDAERVFSMDFTAFPDNLGRLVKFGS